MFAHEFLGTVPDGRDGFDIFVQADHETILLFIFGHEPERIKLHVTKDLDAWLDPPIPFVILEEGLS